MSSAGVRMRPRSGARWRLRPGKWSLSREACGTPMTVRNSTPLIALDGLVLDTETTGLDPAVARIVEIGAIALAGGRAQPADTLHALVRPGSPIPPAATAIHGIDDAKIADAPTFAAVWPKLRERIGASVVVGHNLGFDLAVLR